MRKIQGRLTCPYGWVHSFQIYRSNFKSLCVRRMERRNTYSEDL